MCSNANGCITHHLRTYRQTKCTSCNFMHNNYGYEDVSTTQRRAFNFQVQMEGMLPSIFFPFAAWGWNTHQGLFQKIEHVFWQVFCFSKCSPFVPFSSHDIWWISQNKEGKNWTKPIARGFTLHKSDSCKLHKIPALHC